METDFIIPITALTAALLGALMLFMTTSLALYRRTRQVSFGDGGDGQFAKRLRGQGNAVEQIPIAIILLGFAEALGTPDLFVWIIAALLVLGRYMHAIQFWNRGALFTLRPFGVLLTLIGQACAILSILLALFL